MSANQQLLAHLCGLALVIVLKLLRTVPITFDSSPVNSITSPISVPRMSSSPLLSSVLWTQLSVIIDTLITNTCIANHRYLDYNFCFFLSPPGLQPFFLHWPAQCCPSHRGNYKKYGKYLTLLYVLVVVHVLFIPIYLDKDDHIEQRCQADPCVDGEQSNKAKGSLDWIFGESVTYI